MHWFLSDSACPVIVMETATERCFLHWKFNWIGKTDGLLYVAATRIQNIIRCSKIYGDGIQEQLKGDLAKEDGLTLRCHKSCISNANVATVGKRHVRYLLKLPDDRLAVKVILSTFKIIVSLVIQSVLLRRIRKTYLAGGLRTCTVRSKARRLFWKYVTNERTTWPVMSAFVLPVLSAISMQLMSDIILIADKGSYRAKFCQVARPPVFKAYIELHGDQQLCRAWEGW